MAYMNKQLRHYVEEADKIFIIPNSFYNFINYHKSIENLIIKKGKTYHCTHCHYEFNSNAKIGKELKCPNCKGKYTTRRSTLKRYFTKKDLILLNKVEDKFVLRVFELYAQYNYELMAFDYSCTEYRRVFFDDKGYNQVVEGDNVFHTMGLSVVWHNHVRTCWKKKEWTWYYRSYGDSIGYISPYNIKPLLKNTPYQYSQLWKFVRKIKIFNLVELFQRCLSGYCNTFELLVKARLYNLAFYSFRFSNQKKTFEERFGVPKSFLPFMQKHNITYDELNVLRCCKTPNIRLLKALSGCNNLLWLSYYVDCLTAWKMGILSKRTEHEYKDYLTFAIQLNYDMKDKSILYPNNLKLAHDKLEGLVELCQNEANTRLIKERYEKLKVNIYQNKKFIIYPINNSEELICESKQQSNCVKNYIEKVALGETDIYLMRLLSNPNKSLVTVEVRNNKIVQAKIKYNKEISKEQQRFLDIWQAKILSKQTI